MPKITREQPPQNPNLLLDRLQQTLAVTTDVALARLLGVPAPVISKLRHGRLRVSSSFLIHAHDASGLSIGELRAWLYTPVDATHVRPDGRLRAGSDQGANGPAGGGGHSMSTLAGHP